eukprot:CAMPEP_0197707450 /NCGR_PEP_ID=MMETSP1338-20131121/127456_1 /TAXON_ID=43686 ORGANISM="Pelagodinium beii, Strain RCC1491" /NCGR_SAMPLE_ID=MMETSP1338 /ASSEMBLY_ACC=CAM_ASM_000754 /LENGTH=582 /DNA_ID=CAMNT_0043291375 /DNA_START=54 /DNA_END=1802 /DNA_ORIENTATION=-
MAMQNWVPQSGLMPVLNLDAVTPAMPEEVEQFLILNPVEDKAAQQFRTMDPKSQRMCINKGTLQGARDTTAAFIGRMSQVRGIFRNAVSASAQAAAGGMVMSGQQSGGNLDQIAPATPQEVEMFLMSNPMEGKVQDQFRNMDAKAQRLVLNRGSLEDPMEGKVQDQFRNMDAKAQRLVLNRGSLEGSRDPTAAFIGRMVKIDQLVKKSASNVDWICPSCGFTNFGRNMQCLKCHQPKPAETPVMAPMEGCGGMGGGMGYGMGGGMGGGMMGGMGGGMDGGMMGGMGGCAGGGGMGGGMMGGMGGGMDGGMMGGMGVDMSGGMMGGMGGCAGGYGAMRNGGMMQQSAASPYGQAGGAANAMAGVVPATPVEVEEFLILNPVEQKVADQLRNMDPAAQKLVLDRGSLEGARDPTASLIGRIVKIRKLMSGGGMGGGGMQFQQSGGMQQFQQPAGMQQFQQFQQFQQPAPTAQQTIPATPEEVEQFLILNQVEQHAQDKFRAMNPQAQRWVINRGGLNNANDKTGAFIGRMVQVERVANGQVQVPPGDWICANCGDHQFARNTVCRSCGAPKSMSQVMGIVINPL